MKNTILSVIVIIYDMPRQALNTIYSLSCDYQKNISRNDYEIILVENRSDNMVDANKLIDMNANIRYFVNDKDTQSPAKAINMGLKEAAGSIVGLMIDGARLVTPRVLEYALMAAAANRSFLAAVPSYNLGEIQHQHNLSSNYSEEKEISLLEACQWKNNGYRLFDIGSIGDANQNGFMNPLLESNCFFSTKENFFLIGGANEEFSLPGGGSLNLHMFRQLGTLENTSYYILLSEGTFHQFHGGVTTSQIDDREEVLESHRKQLHSYWNDGFHAMRREPVLLGSPTSHSLPYLAYSSQRNMARSKRLESISKPLWPDDFPGQTS